MDKVAAMSAEDLQSLGGADEVVKWERELDEAWERERPFRKAAESAVRIYEGDEKSPFNILYSNVETMRPAVYSAVPRPAAMRRFRDKDPIAKAVAETLNRTLSYFLDTDSDEYTTFDTLMRVAVNDALVPGRGVTRFKYEGQIDPQAGTQYEMVCGDEVPWDRFRHGFARTWKSVPWIAYQWFFTKEELVAEFFFTPEEQLELLPTASMAQVSKPDSPDDDLAAAAAEGEKKCIYFEVFEIWDKARKEVVFILRGFDSRPIRRMLDPLQLSGFFNCPEPLMFFRRVSGLLPQPLYAFYESQAQEINDLSRRIQQIVKAIRARGFYDARLKGFEELFEGNDLKMIPVSELEALDGNGVAGMDKHLWMMPIDKMVSVVQTLMAEREKAKQVIYEITGIADILRGASVASETLGAQQIKEQWGRVRLRAMQQEVARYVVESLRIMAEIAAARLQPQTIMAITGQDLPTAQAREQARMQVQAFQQQAALAAQAGQQLPPPPEAQQVMALAQAPVVWEDVFAVLKNDRLRSYKIDIESNSTLDAEATGDMEQIAALMNGMAQFMSGAAPLVQGGALSADAAKQMLGVIVRRYPFGDKIEDFLNQPPAPQPPDPKAEADKAKAQAEQVKAKVEIEKAQLDKQTAEIEAKARQQELTLQMEMNRQLHAQKMAQAEAQKQLAFAKAAVPAVMKQGAGQ
jgi:hypothetical protein